LQALPAPSDLAPSEREERSMAWRTPTDAEIAARIDREGREVAA
jgi:hypothetical protein